MRTTITVADDVYAEMERMRVVDGLGPSEALNVLARRGMVRGASPSSVYVLEPADVGLRIDVSNIGDVLDVLDVPDQPDTPAAP